MTTNKPEVVAYRYTASRSFGKRNRKWHYQESFPHAANRKVEEVGQMEELVRLTDYEALQAECEQLRTLLSQSAPIVRAHAGASHMLDGFKPKRNKWDELVERIDAAIQGDH